MKPVNTLVGSAIERVEDYRFLTGRGCFVADLAVQGLLHAAVRRSEFAHARIVKIDTASARALPGVAAVITAADMDGVPIIPLRQHGVPEGEFYRQPVIAIEKFRYVGEPAAIVIADDPALAEDALELINIEAEDLPVVADCAVAAQDR